MRPIRLVIFDVTGTLLKPTRPAGAQYAEAAVKHLGLPLERYDLAKQCMQTSFLTNYRAQLDLYPCFGALHQVSVSDWWYSVFSKCVRECVSELSTVSGAGLVYSDRELRTAFQDVYDNFQWDLLPHVEETLSSLKAVPSGDKDFVTLAAISNGDHRTPTTLSEKGILKYFDTVVTSVDAKCEKPDPRIFDYALNKLSLSMINRKQILVVGDVFESDYMAALKAGMQAVLLTDEKNRETPVVDESHRAPDLTAVLSYVKEANLGSVGRSSPPH